MRLNQEAISSTAYFDSLFISIRLQDLLGGVSAAELHLLAYLSCLLALYERSPISDWGYEFTGTTEGSPYSRAIASAIDLMESKGVLNRQDFVSQLTTQGYAEYSVLDSLQTYKKRQRYLDGACASLFSLPIGTLRDALSNEPELKSASIHRMARRLLEGPGVESLYEQFELLRSALDDDSSDILTPAMVWLTYLQSVVTTTEIRE